MGHALLFLRLICGAVAFAPTRLTRPTTTRRSVVLRSSSDSDKDDAIADLLRRAAALREETAQAEDPAPPEESATPADPPEGPAPPSFAATPEDPPEGPAPPNFAPGAAAAARGLAEARRREAEAAAARDVIEARRAEAERLAAEMADGDALIPMDTPPKLGAARWAPPSKKGDAPTGAGQVRPFARRREVRGGRDVPYSRNPYREEFGLVNRAADPRTFAAVGTALALSFVLYLSVFLSGGIDDGARRYLDDTVAGDDNVALPQAARNFDDISERIWI